MRLLVCAVCISQSLYAQTTPVTPAPDPTTTAAEAPQAAASPRESSPEPSSPDAPPAPPGTMPQIKSVAPDTYYVRSPHGELVPVLSGLTPEEINELLDIRNGIFQRDRVPTYSLESLDVTGEQQNDKVDLVATFTIRLKSTKAVRVPLRLKTASLVDRPEYRGDGEYTLEFAEDGTGYVIWLRGDVDSVHEVELHLIAKTRTAGRQTSLSLPLPFPVRSQLSLRVPDATAEASVSDGTLFTIRQLGGTDESQGGAEFRVIGGQGDFQIEWGAALRKPSSQVGLFEAEGKILAEFVPPGVVSNDVRLRLRGFGEPLQNVLVKLPAGAQWRPTSGPQEYSISLLSSETDSAESPTVQISFDPPTLGPVQVQLLYEQRFSGPESANDVEVGNIEVVGAFRHHGNLALAAADMWRLRWESSPGLQRVWQSPEEWNTKPVVASFDYFVQPFHLPVGISAESRTIHAEPVLIYDVDRSEVNLRANFHPTIAGTPAQELQIAMAPWTYTGLGETDLVDQSNVDGSQVSPLVVPFRQSRRGEVPLEILATKKTAFDQTTLTLELPYIPAANSSPPLIIVRPRDGLLLRQLPTQNTQFTVVPLPEAYRLPEESDTTLCFRYHGPAPGAHMQLELQDQPVSIVGTSNVRVAWEPPQLKVRQDWKLKVEHQPITSLSFWFPGHLAENAISLVTVADREVPVHLDDNDDSATDEDDTESWRRFVCEFPRPILSEMVNVGLEFQTSLEIPVDNARVPMTFPLVRLAEGIVEETTVVVNTPANIQVETRDMVGTTRTTQSTNDQVNSLVLVCEGAREDLKVDAVLTQYQPAHETMIQRMFLQTWITPGERRDRCVARLRSSDQVVSVELPRLAEIKRLQVVVDQTAVRHQAQEDGTIVIPLPSGTSDEHTVELVYPMSTPAIHRDVEIPQFVDVDWFDQFYWQLILPDRRHLVLPPRGLDSEDTWQWTGWGFRRVARYDQQWLERWTYATKQPAPPVGINQYLYSGFGELHTIPYATARRAVLILTAT
ncbi:MAG: hypothetical protein KDA60_15025, partial [Planctomycetales bacterium]|nr:hypothetical protein [Planctomycetales bacterium]